jgi:outer membrane protein OmpA-like peptidoglycan-associated protein
LNSDQLNAVFSVPGKSEYNFKPGFKPEVGELKLTVTFTPENNSEYMVLSTSRVIQVLPKPKTSPTPIAQPSKSASPQPKPLIVTALSLKKIGTIYFRNNEYFLDAKDRTALKELSLEIKAQNFKTVIIQGNTDVKKGVDNYWLSKARAEAVSNYLGALAPSPLYNRVWYASKRPVSIGLDKQSLALNRRVEIYVQVKTQKEVNASPAPSLNLAKSYEPITFNRNESFLDADDRQILLASVKDMASLGCKRVYLKGSRDQTSSSVNSYIVTNRVGAVKKFMTGINPSLKFTIEPGFISANREVRIRCSS